MRISSMRLRFSIVAWYFLSHSSVFVLLFSILVCLSVFLSFSSRYSLQRLSSISFLRFSSYRILLILSSSILVFSMVSRSMRSLSSVYLRASSSRVRVSVSVIWLMRIFSSCSLLMRSSYSWRSRVTLSSYSSLRLLSSSVLLLYSSSLVRR